jgi:hypothetical protein
VFKTVLESGELAFLILSFAKNTSTVISLSGYALIAVHVWFYWLLKTVDGASTRAM